MAARGKIPSFKGLVEILRYAQNNIGSFPDDNESGETPKKEKEDHG